MNRLFLLAILCLSLVSCGGDESRPEDALKEFITAINDGDNINLLHNESSRYIEFGYSKTRKYAEKFDASKITCETDGEEADCVCETVSGKKRKFKLIKSDDKWLLSLNQPELILEIFHIMYTQGMIKDIKPFATQTELERIKVFEGLTENMEIPESDRRTVPFEIKCKTFKKKYECTCISEEGESAYILFRTSKGWKAELGEVPVVEDTLIDYNSDPDFNLNQKDLDSLTEFSQKMLDSMLNL